MNDDEQHTPPVDPDEVKSPDEEVDEEVTG